MGELRRYFANIWGVIENLSRGASKFNRLIQHLWGATKGCISTGTESQNLLRLRFSKKRNVFF